MNWTFWKKNNHSRYDLCTQCKKELINSDLLALQKEEGMDEDDDPIVDDEKLFCSEACLNQYLEHNELTDYNLVKLSRCSCYYDCKEIDNLRKMCEREEQIERNTHPLLPNIHLLTPFCNPANAGIIKASLALKKQAEKSSRSSNIQFALNIFFTVIIILLTIGNFLLVSNDGTNDLMEKSNNNLNAIHINSNQTVTAINNLIEKNNELIKLQEENNMLMRLNKT